MILLHDHQLDLVERVRDAYRAGKKAPLVVLPTGGGKTVTFSYIAQNSAMKGSCIFIIAHRSELIKQISQTLARFDVLHDIIAPPDVIRQAKLAHFYEFNRSYVDYRSSVYVGSVQTMARRLSTIKRSPDLIIIDEAHHLTSGSQWGKVVDAFPDARRLLVTATPCRLDGKGLDEYADTMIVGKSMRWLIEHGYLSDYRIFGPPNSLNLDAVKRRAGDYAVDQLEVAVDKPSITGDAVDHYRRMCMGKRAIVFCVTIKHGRHVAEQFKAAGVPAEMLETDNRESAIERFKTGETLVLTSCEIVSEGFDLPAIEAAILLRPTQSTGLYLQQVGRALRVMKGKAEAIILDHVGNTMRHGLPDDDREWTLEGAKRRAKSDADPDLKIQRCPTCFAVHRPAPVCQTCGHVYVAGAKPRDIKQVEGDLVEIKRQAVVQRKREERDCKTEEDFYQLGVQRGYQYPRPWAKKRYSFRQKRVKS